MVMPSIHPGMSWLPMQSQQHLLVTEIEKNKTVECNTSTDWKVVKMNH